MKQDESYRWYNFAGQHRHHIYQRTDGTNPWTLIVVEDVPDAYRHMFIELTKRNIVGRALTMDFDDENSLLKLLTDGSAVLGNKEKVEVANSRLCIVVLDSWDDRKSNLYRGFEILEQIRPFTDYALIATALPRAQLEQMPALRGKLDNLGILDLQKSGGVLSAESLERLIGAVQDYKRTFERNRFVIRGDTCEVSFVAEDGSFEFTGPLPLTTGALMQHWVLLKRVVPLEDLGMYIKYTEGSMTKQPSKKRRQVLKRERRSHEQIFREFIEGSGSIVQLDNEGELTKHDDEGKPSRDSRPKPSDRDNLDEERVRVQKQVAEASAELEALTPQLSMVAAIKLFVNAEAEGKDGLKRAAERCEKLLEQLSSSADLREILDRQSPLESKIEDLKRATTADGNISDALRVLGERELLTGIQLFVERFLDLANSPSTVTDAVADKLEVEIARTKQEYNYAAQKHQSAVMRLSDINNPGKLDRKRNYNSLAESVKADLKHFRNALDPKKCPKLILHLRACIHTDSDNGCVLYGQNIPQRKKILKRCKNNPEKLRNELESLKADTIGWQVVPNTLPVFPPDVDPWKLPFYRYYAEKNGIMREAAKPLPD